MILILATFAVVGLGLIAFGARLGRGAFAVGAVPPLAATIWVTAHLDGVSRGHPVVARLAWVGDLHLAADLRLDGLAATMSLIVAAVGVLVFAYCGGYFGRDTPGLGRLAGLLVLFAGAMLVVVQADHALLLYTGWELTSVTSYLLIGTDYADRRARAAALHALLVTGAGGLALLGGLVILGHEAGSYHLSDIVRNPPASTATTAAVILVLAGALTKSAQYPFHAWLPGAMAAPTPVSAYLHSATMVKAGVFVVARFAPAFAATGSWRPLVVGVGSATLVFGGLRALRQHDLKLLLAFGTVSQLGLLMILFGAGTPATWTAGWVLLVAHAAFKAALFMVVGVLDRGTGTRDIRHIPALGRPWRGVEIVSFAAVASMAGVPLGAGFVAKELAYSGLGRGDFAGSGVVLAVAAAGSLLTVAYGARFHWGAFVAPRRHGTTASSAPPSSPSPPSAGFVLPAAVLAAAGVVLGVVPGVANRLAGASLSGFADAGPVHLGLWHGFGLPLVLSAVALAGGVVVAAGDRRVQPLLAWGSRLPSGAELYLAGLAKLGAVASRTTAVVQSGSLPVYTGVILATAAVVPAVALARAGPWPGWPALGSLTEAPIAVALVVTAVGAAVVPRRFAAAVLLGTTGYAMAGLFVLSGAPDLALTQAAVETLSTVVFVLVLRRLPERFEQEAVPERRILRLAVAATVGVTVFVFALVAAGHRITPPVSIDMVARAVPDGHGQNVVNVILVDFRGWDTLGEITVLAVASIGAVALARVGRRAAEASGRPADSGPSGSVRRLPFVDVAFRVVFPVVLMTSLWLLFAGHNQPGGGFVGGLLAGSAITLRYLAGGIEELRARSRFRPWTVLGAGVILAAATASVPLLTGSDPLAVGLATVHLPLIGAVKISSALVFDTGVYLAVLGMVLMVYEAFGDEPTEAAR
jgi:multicomponent Na+:H+ antiporter subunit A